jgi:hypothetical protein
MGVSQCIQALAAAYEEEVIFRCFGRHPRPYSSTHCTELMVELAVWAHGGPAGVELTEAMRAGGRAYGLEAAVLEVENASFKELHAVRDALISHQSDCSSIEFLHVCGQYYVEDRLKGLRMDAVGRWVIAAGWCKNVDAAARRVQRAWAAYRWRRNVLFNPHTR